MLKKSSENIENRYFLGTYVSNMFTLNSSNRYISCITLSQKYKVTLKGMTR